MTVARILSGRLRTAIVSMDILRDGGWSFHRG
jgi:hypothetical protein